MRVQNDKDCLQTMSEQKDHRFRPPLYRGESNGKTPQKVGANGQAASEQQGWEAYRKWLSRVSTQPAQRAPLDASIYSWKGYNSWAEKVRQTWKSDEPVDS
jgi:hypothetical protein